MALQFRKRIKIAPGISLNLGKKGLSVSAGVRGARITFGKDRATTSVGIPGTGIYDRSSKSRRPSVPAPADADGGSRALITGILFVLFVIGAAKLISVVF